MPQEQYLNNDNNRLDKRQINIFFQFVNQIRNCRHFTNEPIQAR